MRKTSAITEPGAAAIDGHEVKGLDERVRRSRATVLDVTTQLLIERGFSGATVDEISRRSGVAKTTIYRHWPTRTDLLRDACSTLSTPLEAPNTGTFLADLTALMIDLTQILRSAKWTSVLPSIIDEAERDPDLAEMYSKLQRGYSAPFEAVFQRASQRGELPKDADIPMLIAALTGPLFYRRWFSREPLTDVFARQIVVHVTK
jgi:AcrR family transcriptional regulator